MIGIVLVSHSAKAAEGACEIANQMVQGKVRLAAAGGVDDPEQPIGTSATKVLEAIETVYSEDGVLVLMDLGSALMSTETALDFLPEEQRAKVYLCSAPLIEGAVAAATQATVTTNIHQIMAEAQGALAAKISHLQDTPAPTPIPLAGTAPGREIRLVITNKLGLHARPAAKFVTTAAQFQAQVTVRNVTKQIGPVNARSINQVTTLGARQGHELAVMAAGPEADKALAALAALAAANFGEDEAELPAPAAPAAVPVAQAVEGELVGIPVWPGIALGPAVRFQVKFIELPEETTTQPQAEWDRLQEALQKAKEEVKVLYAQALAQLGSQKADI